MLLFRLASPFTAGSSTISPSSISLSDLPPEEVATGPGVDSLVSAEEKNVGTDNFLLLTNYLIWN